jgi:hypothetical protein
MYVHNILESGYGKLGNNVIHNKEGYYMYTIAFARFWYQIIPKLQKY